MALTLYDLEPPTRDLMLEEIQHDIQSRGVYISRYLNSEGAIAWPQLLLAAAASGTDATLARALSDGRCFRSQAERRKPSGGVTLAAVPVTAATTLAESQFNMYYIRALCRRAISEKRNLLVYRAKSVSHPRPESERLVGHHLDPENVLSTLRETKGVEPSIGIPMPNSGLSVRLE